MMIKILVAAISIWALAGCASAPMKFADVNDANWKAKALIKDKEQSKSYIVNLNFNLKKNENTRMDVTTTLGGGVASLVADNKEVRYVLVDSKRFYYGSPQPGVMRPILAVPFDPRWLQNILFELPLSEKTWTCTKDGNGWLQECQDSATGVKITWSQRQGVKKTILIDHAKATVQINVQSFKPKVEERNNLFTLEAPQGFEKLRVR